MYKKISNIIKGLSPRRVGIDLGTANCLVYLEGKGIVLNEPTVVAVAFDDNRVVAVGREAKKMLGRTPENIVASRPLREGVIANYRITEAMIRYFIREALGPHFMKPEVMVCIPTGATQVERRAVMEATIQAGAKTVYLIDEPLAAAIGAQMPIAEASGNMIVDIGGGSTEIAVIALGGVVVHDSLRVGGNLIDEAIMAYLRKNYNLIIGDQTAEEVKIKIGSATKPEKEDKMEIKGRDSLLGLPRSIELTSSQINEAIQPVLTQMVGAVKGVLEDTPPELARDIIDKGIVFSGGTSLLKNLDRLMTEEIGVPCFVAPDPILCIVKGTGIAIENIDLYKRAISKQ
ncbi:MAG: rod shape-determining protein [Candidatus Shapirobacteria bacterium]|nr:rod shape-determining protein [Candidatus Shapirobacteria bacterium]